MKYKIIISGMILFVSAIATLCHADEKRVQVATLADYAPFCMTDDKFINSQVIPVGKDAVGFRGYSWDVLRTSLHEMGYTIHLSIVPWVRALDMVKKGKSDVLFPTGKNSEREKIFYYSEESINDANFIVYVSKKNQIVWDGIKSLGGLTIGFKRGYNYGDIWAGAIDINKVPVNTILQGFKLLDAKRIDGFVGYEYNWDYVLKESGWKNEYRRLPAFDSSSEYLVTIKSNKKGVKILNVFDAGKKRIIHSGELEKIKVRWFGR